MKQETLISTRIKIIPRAKKKADDVYRHDDPEYIGLIITKGLKYSPTNLEVKRRMKN